MDTPNRCILIPREVGLYDLRESLIKHFPNTIFSAIDDWEVQRFGFPDIPNVVLVDYETLETLLHIVVTPLPSKPLYIVIRFDNAAVLPNKDLNLTYIDPFPCSLQDFISNICKNLAALGCE